jgi:hypothetical protein
VTPRIEGDLSKWVVQKRAVKVLDFDLHGSPYTHTKANVALNSIFLVLSIEQNSPP